MNWEFLPKWSVDKFCLVQLSPQSTGRGDIAAAPPPPYSSLIYMPTPHCPPPPPPQRTLV